MDAEQINKGAVYLWSQLVVHGINQTPWKDKRPMGVGIWQELTGYGIRPSSYGMHQSIHRCFWEFHHFLLSLFDVQKCLSKANPQAAFRPVRFSLKEGGADVAREVAEPFVVHVLPKSCCDAILSRLAYLYSTFPLRHRDLEIHAGPGGSLPWWSCPAMSSSIGWSWRWKFCLLGYLPNY